MVPNNKNNRTFLQIVIALWVVCTQNFYAELPLFGLHDHIELLWGNLPAISNNISRVVTLSTRSVWVLLLLLVALTFLHRPFSTLETSDEHRRVTGLLLLLLFSDLKQWLLDMVGSWLFLLSFHILLKWRIISLSNRLLLFSTLSHFWLSFGMRLEAMTCCLYL